MKLRPRSAHPVDGECSSSDLDGRAASSRGPVAVTTGHIREILGSLEFFQAMGASLQSKLALITGSATYPAGTVIFQEGDPPGNCYVILSGKVGVYILEGDEEDSFADEAVPGVFERRRSVSAEKNSRQSVLSLTESLLSRPESTPNEEGGSLPPAQHLPRLSGTSARRSKRMSCAPLEQIAEAAVHETVEGFSCYKEGSYLGRCVNKMGKWELLGELALLHDSARSATAKCVEDVEVLVIERREFDQIFKEELDHANKHKLNFLQDHVPGMREVRCARGKSHAAYNFRQTTFPKGHIFMRQGSMTEESVYVVTKGTVQVGVREHMTPNARLQHLSTLLPGCFFGLLPAAAAPAPFTVVASAGSVEVFYALSEDVCRMPRQLVENMRDYLQQTTMFRLQKEQQCRAAKQGTAGAVAAARQSTASGRPRQGQAASTSSSPPPRRGLPVQLSLPNIRPTGLGSNDFHGRKGSKQSSLGMGSNDFHGRKGSKQSQSSSDGHWRKGSKQSTRGDSASAARLPNVPQRACSPAGPHHRISPKESTRWAHLWNKCSMETTA